MTHSPFDQVIPFQVEDPGVRGRLVRVGPLLARMERGHGYPPAVARLLGEATVLAAVLASGLKYDGLFTLQIQGSGPVGLMVVDVTADGGVRGYARFDADGVARAQSAKGSVVPRLLGAGHMAFTVDQGADMDRYQGIVALEGGTLAECAQNYFRQSEQMESAILLASADDAAGAIMVQRLPGASAPHATEDADEAWRRTVVLMSSTSAAELTDGALDAETLLYRLFHEDGVRVFEAKALTHACRCSRARVERTLKSFPETEIRAMAEEGPEGHTITVTCEFCKETYVFAERELAALFTGAN